MIEIIPAGQPVAPVVQLAELRFAPVPGVVKMLEDALDRARAGEIRALGLITCTQDHGTATAYSLGDGTVSELVCGGRRLELRLLKIGGEDDP